MGQPDPMFLLKAEYDADETPHKVDLGAGVLRDEQGECYELPIVRKAKETLAQKRLGHDVGRLTSPRCLPGALDSLLTIDTVQTNDRDCLF